MGHLATRHYMAMFDDAAYHFLHEIGGRFGSAELDGLGWADVRHLVTYHSEARSGDLVLIETRPTQLGKTSVSYTQTMLEAGTRKTLAAQEATTVRFDLSERRAIAIEEPLRETIGLWMSS